MPHRRFCNGNWILFVKGYVSHSKDDGEKKQLDKFERRF